MTKNYILIFCDFFELKLPIVEMQLKIDKKHLKSGGVQPLL